ncbi:MAG: hypothetical protein AAF569_03055 [Pseudomonadota bacterium]
MIHRVNTNIPVEELSLRYCSCCFKKFCPRPELIESETVRFFVPTIDSLCRDHFAYIEMPRQLVDELYNRKEKFHINLNEVAKILHIEIGDLPSIEREQEITSFFGVVSDFNAYTSNRLAA